MRECGAYSDEVIVVVAELVEYEEDQPTKYGQQKQYLRKNSIKIL